MNYPEYERLYRTVFETSGTAMMIIEEDMLITVINREFAKLSGYSKEEVENKKKWTEFISEDDLPRMKAYHENRRNDKGGAVPYQYECKLITRGGSIRDIYATVNIIPGTKHSVAAFLDITERRITEVALKESESKYRLLFNNVGDAIVVHDEELHILAVNAIACKRYGYSESELLASTIKMLNTPQENARVPDLSSELNKKGYSFFETVHKSRDGVLIYTDVNAQQITWHGKPAIISVCRDITERKRGEEALRQAEEKFSKAFHGGPIMMTLATVAEGRFIDVNEAICAGLGYTREEIISKPTKELNLYTILGRGQELGKMLMEVGKLENIEVSFRTKLGETREGRAWSQLFYLDGQPCQITGLVDVTEQNRMQNELVKLERLSLVGEIAAGIGHEIRNPMTSVRGLLQILKDRYSEDEDLVNLMIEELDRANYIITEFLSLAKNKKVELLPQNLNAITRKILPLIQCSASNQGKVVIMETEDIPDLLLDEKDIRQLLMNLINNGLEAMPTGGTVTIRTQVEKENVVLSIDDQGIGVDPEVFDKLGTPFLTTKENGTGLGLAACYGIANRYKAKIDVETSLDGTTFSVRFPMSN